MILSLQKVLPRTINENLIKDSNFWQKTIDFEPESINIIEATSGTGKSTFIKIITGLSTPKSGNVLYDDINIQMLNKNEICAFRKKHISTVFQDLQLIPNFSGRDNISINFPSPTFNENKFNELITRLNIRTVIDQPAHTLSLGEQQRVAIVRALAKNYNWLIMDEPFSHLDKENSEAALNIIVEDAKEKNAGVIITSLGNESYLNGLNTLSI